ARSANYCDHFTLTLPPRPRSFPYTPLFRSRFDGALERRAGLRHAQVQRVVALRGELTVGLHHDDGVVVLDGDLDVAEAVLLEQRSEEHTSELQSRFDLVCRLLLEKKKKRNN